MQYIKPLLYTSYYIFTQLVGHSETAILVMWRQSTSLVESFLGLKETLDDIKQAL